MSSEFEHFGEGTCRHADQQWGFFGRDRFIPVDDLMDRVVNIGTKDGLVFEHATVAGFTASRGILTLTGGICGSVYGDKQGEPNDAANVLMHDIARGYLHPEDVS